MPQGWKSNVWQTDVEPEKYRGFFYDDAQAQAWIDKQPEGTFRISDQGPRKAKEAK